MTRTSAEAILVANHDGRIIEANPAAERVFGRSKIDMLGRSFAEVATLPEHEFGLECRDGAGEDVSGRAFVPQRVEACRADGTMFPANLWVRRIETSGGQIMLYVLHDMSDQVASETALLDARDGALAAAQTKSNFLAVMSHEMRTPLNGVLGALDLLGRTELSQGQREYLDIMKKSGELLLHHVNDVLELSRLDVEQDEPSDDVFDLSEMMSDIAESLRHIADASASEIEVVMTGEGLAHVRGAERRLRQVLLNLAGNAVKFTTSGKITLTATRLAGDTAVAISVKDTGIGIAPSDQDRIFEEFVTLDSAYNRSSEGTGLGLAITRRLVEAMGGDIALASEIGRGATFTVTLDMPVVPVGRRAMDALTVHDAQPPKFSGMNVLLVEDNPINRKIAHAMLDALDCRVVEAENGTVGVDLAQDELFDVILMDISMPEMDGIEATRRIRAGPSASKDARIIALTAHAMEEDVARFRNAGMNDVAVKPISTDGLVAVLDRRSQTSATDAANEADTAWDMAAFGEFLQVLGPQDTQDMLAQFLKDAGEIVPWLIWQSSENLAHAEVAKKAHGVAGSAAVMGATALHEALRHLEQTARKDQSLTRSGGQLEQVWAQTMQSVPMIEGQHIKVA